MKTPFTTDRAIRIMAGSFILLSLAQPVPERLHAFLSGRIAHGLAGYEALRRRKL